MATIAGLRKRGADLLTRFASVLYHPDHQKRDAIYDIGKNELPVKSKRAVVIYVINSIRYYVNSELEKFPHLQSHSMWLESIEMVKALNASGYIVDCLNTFKEHRIDWNKYDLIIDERNNITGSPKIAGQTKVVYSTGSYWLHHNLAELTRIRQFYERTGIITSPLRQTKPLFSDLYGDFLTHFGSQNQLKGYSEKIKKHSLNISASVPAYAKKNIDKCRNKFLWIGGSGLIHKGLDLTMEAFAQIPGAELFIAGTLTGDPAFVEWCNNILKKNSNIHCLGWVDISSENFRNIADHCIGVVYTSCAEGGPGSVAQAMHHGLIPVTTIDSNARGSELGRIIHSRDDHEIINGVVKHVNEIRSLSEPELNILSEKIREYALRTFTLEKYTESFNSLLHLIN